MKKIVSGLIATAMLWSTLAPTVRIARAQIIGKVREEKLRDVPVGLVFSLSEGAAGAETRRLQPPATAEPISSGETESILKRLPGIKTDPDDTADFAKRIGTLPAPKTGEIVPVKFPADEPRDKPNTDSERLPLEVVRYSPEGLVSLAPDLSITFSQPMVAVSSQEEAAEYVPVELTPQAEGKWRWLGTRTLVFDTAKRFPMATKFTARVPAGTKSAVGQQLAKDVLWTFTTPPPKAIQMYPTSQTVRRDELIYVVFDQEIIPEAVLPMVTVTAGGKQIAIRPATEGEMAGRGLNAPSYKGRVLAFYAVNPDGSTHNALPPDSAITVKIGKGTPSAEGPLTTTADQRFSFRTFGPLKFDRAHCGWDARRVSCNPDEDLVLNFNNILVSTSVTDSTVKIDPPIQNPKIYSSGNQIRISGRKKGNTTYNITVGEALRDVFNQVLGTVITASLKVGRSEPWITSEGGAMVIHDPLAAPSFSLFSLNHGSFKLKLYRVEPADWYQFEKYFYEFRYNRREKTELPGKLIADRLVSIQNSPDEMVETRIDLSPALNLGLGHVIVDIEPTLKKNSYDNQRILSWVQVTQIGLDAFVDNTELVGFATDLKTGAPLSGVDFSIMPDGAGEPIEKSETTDAGGEGYFAGIWRWIWGGGTSAESLNQDGTPLETSTLGAAPSSQTGPNGILRLALSDKVSSRQNVLVARRGSDSAFLPEYSEGYYWGNGGQWHKQSGADFLKWFVFDDRGIYKPKEEISLKGYIRNVAYGTLGDIEGVGGKPRNFDWSAKDARNNEIAKGTITTNPFGAFDFKFSLPDNVNLGAGRIEFTNPGSEQSVYAHTFQVQEFRRPEFEVKTSVDSEAPYFVGGTANLSVEAKYFAGGGLANAKASWNVSASPTTYTPPNRDDFTFGTWVPWWRYNAMDYSRGLSPYGAYQTFQGVTDADGKHRLKIDFESVNPPRPYLISASASVQDVNRQTWSSTSTLLVHPSDLYVGIRTPRTFVQKGEKIDVETIVSDIEGKLVAGRDVEMKAVLKDWTVEAGIWKQITVDEQTCTLKSAEETRKCSFVAKQGGVYTISALVMDDRERLNESEITVWVPGGKTPPNRNVQQEEVQLIPSGKEFAPGDVAELLVIAPFTPAEGVLTLRRDGIAVTERFSMKDSSATLKIPIKESYLPNIHAQVDLVGMADRIAEGPAPTASPAAGKAKKEAKPIKRPAFASGTINLSVSTESRRLAVSAEPREKTLIPGSETKVDVEVKDSSGEPVADSEVAVVIVDESVLALTRYSIADPMSIFYSTRGTGTTDYHLRKDVLLGNPDDVSMPKPSPAAANINVISNRIVSSPNKSQKMGFQLDGSSAAEMSIVIDGFEVANFRSGKLDGNQAGPQITQRTNFDALAVFAPGVRTDSNGRATLDVKLPDNLTRYRITAVSVDAGNRFGKSESNITARQPLMVRPSAPRFLNFGDKADIPVVLQNQTDEEMTVDVVLRAGNAEVAATAQGDKTQNSVGKRVVVKANGREEVRFPVSTIKAGTARFQIAATAGKYSDAAEISLPVWTPATTEAFATYGTTDKNGAIIQPVQAPADVYKDLGGLEVTTSSTQLQELTDSFIYLAHYPYACSEQISSRMISIAALRDVLQAFKSKEIPASAELEAQFKSDIQVLQSRQRDDGSFGLWRKERERYEYPFLTVHAAHALALAKAKGYQVPDEMLARIKPYLANIENYFNNEWYRSSPRVRWTISAYTLYVRDLMGDKDVPKAKRLLREATLEKIPFEALGWILSVLADDADSAAEVEAINRFLLNRTTETAAAANFITDYGDDGWLIMYSNRRADGVILEAMLKQMHGTAADNRPSSATRGAVADLIPKLVRGLLAHRKKGHWGSTQDNVFILLALDKYFNAFEKVTPDFVARVWLGDTYAGEQPFKGRSVDSNVLNIPMEYLSRQGGASNLLLDRRGEGRLYYRIGMKYAPKNLNLQPANYGFAISRKYEAVDDPADVRQEADGSWVLKTGARVRVRLTMVADSRRYHVALVDNLPAGLEILNPGLAVTEVIPNDPNPRSGVVEVFSRSIGRNYMWFRTNWFEHQNFRDERAEAFSSLLWEGVYNYSFVTRATTPGRFIAPPAKAEEMYNPETFGRSGTDIVRVE